LGTFGKLLKTEFEKRIQKNPKFSLRAFARLLKVDPSYLVKIMQGTRNASVSRLVHMAKILELPDDQLRKFTELAAKSRKKQRGSLFRDLKNSQFEEIKEWHYFAILEMTQLENTKLEPKSVATFLGISEKVALESLKKLSRLGLLVFEESNRSYKKAESHSTLAIKGTSASLRQLQVSYLTKAIEAVEKIDYTYRDVATVTLAMDPHGVDEVRALITKFRRDLTKILERPGNKTAIYNLSTLLYPLSKIDEVL